MNHRFLGQGFAEAIVQLIPVQSKLFEEKRLGEQANATL